MAQKIQGTRGTRDRKVRAGNERCICDIFWDPVPGNSQFFIKFIIEITKQVNYINKNDIPNNKILLF